MTELKVHVNYNTLNFQIEGTNTTLYSWHYDFLFENVYSNNGKGRNKLIIRDERKNPTTLLINKWTLSSVIELNFDWTNQIAKLNITDRSGVSRDIEIVSNSRTIFASRDYRHDLTAVIDEFKRIAKHEEWEQIDLLADKVGLETEIAKLTEKVNELKSRLSLYTENIA